MAPAPDVTPAPSARCAPGAYARGAGERPARVQLDLSTVRLQAAEVSGDYNIWYGRYAGERGYARSAPAATRCHLDTDAGLTLADHTESNAPLCLHFARGACAYGKGCNFRHRAPLDADESSAETRVDVFGRERHASFRDDLGGVGSWARDQRTLYVGRICVLATESEVHATVYSHFSEWGEIDYCRVLMGKGCAFVAFKLRCAAEFAKEAMADQSLEADEQLNVRWASEDPNPRAKAERLRASAQLLLDAMRRRGHAPPSAAEPYAAGGGGRDEGDEGDAAKRRRVGDGAEGGGKDVTAGPAAPQTREEAEAQAAALAVATAEEAEAEAALAAAQRELQASSKLDSILGRIEATQPAAGPSAAAPRPRPLPAAPAAGGSPGPLELPPGVDLPPGVELPPGVDLPPGVALPPGPPSDAAAPRAAERAAAGEWVGCWDGQSGQAYYVHSATGESRWAWEWGWAHQQAAEQWAAHEAGAVQQGAAPSLQQQQWTSALAGQQN